MTRRGPLLWALLGLLAPMAAHAGFRIDWYTIDGGGTVNAAAGGRRLDGTAGQPDAGASSSASFRLAGGFWTALQIEQPTPVLVSRFEVAPGAAGPELSWSLERDVVASITGVMVQRALLAAGPFTDRSPWLAPEASMSFHDIAAPGEGDWYRLRLLMRDGSESAAGPVALESARHAPIQTSLSVPSRQAAGPITIGYTIGPDPVSVTITVHDVGGRVVRRLLEAESEPGAFTLTWDGRTENTGRTTAGVYFVRLTAGPVSASKRVVLLGH